MDLFHGDLRRSSLLGRSEGDLIAFTESLLPEMPKAIREMPETECHADQDYRISFFCTKRLERYSGRPASHLLWFVDSATLRKSAQLVSPINRIVEFLDCMSVIGPSQRQRLIRELPELPNCLHQVIDGKLADL